MKGSEIKIGTATETESMIEKGIETGTETGTETGIEIGTEIGIGTVIETKLHVAQRGEGDAPCLHHPHPTRGAAGAQRNGKNLVYSCQ